MCYSTALYGCKLWEKITKTEWTLLERAYCYICKSIQGLPRQTGTDMCLPLLCLTSIESFVNERILLFFFWNLEREKEKGRRKHQTHTERMPSYGHMMTTSCFSY